jgi:CysZ protein
MGAVARAAVRAIPLLGDRRVLSLVLLPLLGAVLLWTTLAVAFWGQISGALARLIGKASAALGSGWPVETLGSIAGNLVTFVALTLVAGAVAVAALAVLAGPVFARAVEVRYFPSLERRRGGTLAGGVLNAATAIALWLAGWLLALPLLFVPGLNVLVPVLLGAWLNQRLFRYDALAEHAAAGERRTIFRVARVRLYGLGLLLAPLAFVPVVNLVAPLHAGLAFTCLCLDELAALRARGARTMREGETTA